MQSSFYYEDDRFVDEFCQEAPMGAIPKDAAERLRMGEEIIIKSSTQITKIKIHDPKLAKKKLN